MAIRIVKRKMDSKKGRLHDTNNMKCLFFDLIEVERIVMFAHLDKISIRTAS